MQAVASSSALLPGGSLLAPGPGLPLAMGRGEGRGMSGSDDGSGRMSAYAVTSGSPGSNALALPGQSPGGPPGAGGLDKDSIMKFYKKRTILPQEKLGAAADLKRNAKDMGFQQDDFRLDPEEVRTAAPNLARRLQAAPRGRSHPLS